MHLLKAWLCAVWSGIMIVVEKHESEHKSEHESEPHESGQHESEQHESVRVGLGVRVGRFHS